jgi:MFS family permease
VAATAIAIALPQLLIGLVAGVLVDRWDLRRVMIASDLTRAVLVLGFLAVTTSDRLWLLYVLAFAQSGVGTFFNPARATLLAAVLPADRLLAANSLFDTSRVVAGVAGVGAAGFLASASPSLSIVFLADAVTFVVSAVLIGLIPDRGLVRHEADNRGVLAGIAAGLRLIRRSRTLVAVVVVGTVGMFGLGAVNVLLVPFVVDDPGASEAWFGALEGAQVTAMVVAGALVVAFSSWSRPSGLIVAGAVGLGTSIAAMAACGAVWQLTILCFAAGWFLTPVQASVTTVLQTESPPQLRGRAQSSFATLVSAASLASMSLAGLVAGLAGIRPILVAAGVIVIVAGVASLAAFRSAVRLPRTAAPEVVK